MKDTDMTPNVKTATMLIHQMDDSELNRIIEAIKVRRNHLTRQKAVTFMVGDRVSFAARGMQVLGTVTKVNPKTIQVKQSNTGTLWRVHASLLSPVKNMVDTP